MNYIIASSDIFFSPVSSRLLTWLLVEFFKIGDDKDEKKVEVVLLTYLGCYFGLYPYSQIKLKGVSKPKLDILEYSSRLQTIARVTHVLSNLVYNRFSY